MGRFRKSESKVVRGTSDRLVIQGHVFIGGVITRRNSEGGLLNKPWTVIML